MGEILTWQLSENGNYNCRSPMGPEERKKAENVSSFLRFQGTGKIELMSCVLCCVSQQGKKKKKPFRFCCQMPFPIGHKDVQHRGKCIQNLCTTFKTRRDPEGMFRKITVGRV